MLRLLLATYKLMSAGGSPQIMGVLHALEGTIHAPLCTSLMLDTLGCLAILWQPPADYTWLLLGYC